MLHRSLRRCLLAEFRTGRATRAGFLPPCVNVSWVATPMLCMALHFPWYQAKGGDSSLVTEVSKIKINSIFDFSFFGKEFSVPFFVFWPLFCPFVCLFLFFVDRFLCTALTVLELDL